MRKTNEYYIEEIWSDITALRNRLVHDYGNVDMTIVYDTLTKDIVELKDRLNNLY